MRQNRPRSRPRRTLTAADIATTSVLGRRSALAIIGGTVAGTAALLGRARRSYGVDNDTTMIADPKSQGSDNDTGKRADPIGGRVDNDVTVKADPKAGCDADEGDPPGTESDSDTGDPCAPPDGGARISDPIGQGTDNDTGRFADPVGRGNDND